MEMPGVEGNAIQEWRYDTAKDLDQPMIERLRRFPREPDMLVYGIRSIVALIFRAWLRLYHRLEIIGRENLPVDGSFVMVANHSSHLDAICLTTALPLPKLHRAFPAAAADYFFVSIPRVAFSAVVVNALPFDRKIEKQQSLELCRNLLANPGNILILFPEGTRTTTGEMGEFKPGVGACVAGTNIPVVPCYLAGAFEAWPKGQFLPRPRKLRLTISAPRYYLTLPPDKNSGIRIAQDLQQAVLELAKDLMDHRQHERGGQV